MGTRERGQASVALIATIPLLLILVLLAARMAIAGHAVVSAANAARAAARAAVTGADTEAAARRALPPALRHGARVGFSGGGLEVTVAAPALLPGSGHVEVAAAAALGPDRGTSP